MSGKSAIVVVVGAAAWLSVVATAGWSPAMADEYGTGTSDTGEFPDSYIHTWCITPSVDGFPKYRDAIYTAMRRVRRQTAMDTGKTSSCYDSTDARWRQTDLGGSRGLEYCRVPVHNGICDSANVEVDVSAIVNDTPNYVQINLDKTATHEVGHSLGLTHHDPPYDYAMINGRIFGGHTTYSPHQVDHINDRFGGAQGTVAYGESAGDVDDEFF